MEWNLHPLIGKRSDGFAGSNDDGSIVVFVDAGGTVSAVDAMDMTKRWDADARGVRIHSPSRTAWLITDERSIARVVDLDTGEELWTPKSVGLTLTDAWSIKMTDDEYVLVEQSDNRHRLRARDGAMMGMRGVATGDVGWVGAVDRYAAWTVDQSGKVRIVDATNGELISSLDVQERITAAHGVQRRIVVRDQAYNAHVFAIEELRELCQFRAGENAELSNDGERVLTWGAPLAGVQVFSAKTGELVWSFEANGPPQFAAWDGRNTIAIITGQGETLLFRDTREVRLDDIRGQVGVAAIDRSARWLAVGGHDGQWNPRVMILDANEGSLVAELTVDSPFASSVTRIRTLVFDLTGDVLVGTTGDVGAVQAWTSRDWRHTWVHDYMGGNPAAIQLGVDNAHQQVWVWGMTNYTQAAYSLADGTRRVDLAGTRLCDFAPSSDGAYVACRRDGTLVLVEPDGRVRLERLDLSEHGAVVSTSSGAVRGHSAALSHVFVRRADGTLVRADKYAREH